MLATDDFVRKFLQRQWQMLRSWHGGRHLEALACPLMWQR
jgi:hypothetical protein